MEPRAVPSDRIPLYCMAMARSGLRGEPIDAPHGMWRRSRGAGRGAAGAATITVGTGASLSHGGVGGGVTKGTVLVELVVVEVNDGLTILDRSTSVGNGGSSCPPELSHAINTRTGTSNQRTPER